MSKARSIVNFGALLFMLVGFPLVSFIYLRKGFEYRKEAILTQGDFGKMPELTKLTPIRGRLPASLRGSMTVVGWLDPTKSEGTELYGLTLDSLYHQFKNSPNLYFTTITIGEPADSLVDAFAETYNLPDDPMISFLRADERDFARTARDFALPLGSYDSPGIQPVVALVDSSLTIVKHYDLARRDETIGLVQLISLIIPLPEKADIILDRGKEL